jgi:acyl dehydratase
MPVNTAVAGTATDALAHDVDARWTMAYACGLGDHNPRYLDTLATHACGLGDHNPRYLDTLATPEPIAHPVFPVCLEWPVILASRTGEADALTDAERTRAVHATHDLHLHRPLRAGEVYRTRARITAVRRTRAGAATTTCLETLDASGEPVCTTWQVGIFRGVDTLGDDRELVAAPAWPELSPPTAASHAVDIGAGDGNVYTECARIFNPIHSDRAVAVAAGLPGPILHGTATLAHAVTRVVDDCLDGDAARVTRLGGRFTAMVEMPSTIEIRIGEATATGVAFEVLRSDGRAALSGGFLCWSR